MDDKQMLNTVGGGVIASLNPTLSQRIQTF